LYRVRDELRERLETVVHELVEVDIQQATNALDRRDVDRDSPGAAGVICECLHAFWSSVRLWTPGVESCCEIDS
jgi:hypothetical protein